MKAQITKTKMQLSTDKRQWKTSPYLDSLLYGDEIWIFGMIVCASIDEEVLKDSKQERYARLNPIFHLEDKAYSVLAAKNCSDGKAELTKRLLC
jgi:hypothetical protein